MFNRLGKFARGFTRFGKTVVGGVARFGKLVLPKIEAGLNMIDRIPVLNEMAAPFTAAGRVAVGLGKDVVDGATALNGALSRGSGYARKAQALMKGGMHVDALNVARDAVRDASQVSQALRSRSTLRKKK
jgi:hypothetical protein